MIVEVLPFALFVALSPINIVAAILLLFSPRPVPAAAAYLAGFAAGVAMVVVGFDLAASAFDWGDDSSTSRAAAVARIVLGVVLLGLAAYKVWKRRTSEHEPTLPKWMDGITNLPPARAARTGFLIGALNPKNVAMAAAASFAVGAAELPTAQVVAVACVYVLLASTGVAAPLVTTLVLGDRARPVLAGWRSWLEANNDLVMAALYLVLGVLLVVNGIAKY